MQTDPKKYKGFINTIMYIIKKEKFSGFYKGIFANTLIAVPINSVQFTVFGLTKNYLKENKNFNSMYINYFLSGCTAGAATLCFVVPLEMIKCNQQINFQGKTKKENRFLKKTQHIYRTMGLTGFYRGFWVTVNRDIISTGLYFNLYYTLKEKLKSLYPEQFGSVWEAFVGGLTGLVAWCFSYPFDTIKTIIQTSNYKGRTPSQLQIIRKLYREGGVFQMYRGATPSLWLSVFYSSLTFVFFEISKDILCD